MKRYDRTGCSDEFCDCGGTMVAADEGEYVRHADVSALVEAARKAEAALVTHERAWVVRGNHVLEHFADRPCQFCAALTALRSALAGEG